MAQIEVGSNGDGRLARRLSGGEAVEVPRRMTVDDVAIGHDRAGRRFILVLDHHCMDAMLGEKSGNCPECRVRGAGDDARVHGAPDGGLLIDSG